MPKINCIEFWLDDICVHFCNNVDTCPLEAECYYRMQLREIIENILDDDTENGAEQA